MTKQIQITKETTEKMSQIRGEWLEKWIAKDGADKVKSWLDDPDKLSLINALAYLEATGQ